MRKLSAADQTFDQETVHYRARKTPNASREITGGTKKGYLATLDGALQIP